MKRVLALSLAVAVGMLLGRMFDGVGGTAEAGGAQGGGAGVAASGDVNGDGAINLSDASYLLNWLFSGGPEPAPCSLGGEAAGLPDTGQTACYGFVENEGWVEVACDDETCAGQDGAHATGCPIDGPDGSGRFVDNGDGTVTDTCTGLMWQQDTADVTGDGIVSFESGDYLPWCEALAYCEELSFADHDDWRLPNVRELQSIVDYGRFNPAIDPVFGALSSWYWSSTSSAGSPGRAWHVLFLDGFVLSMGGKDFVYYVRAVRSGP